VRIFPLAPAEGYDSGYPMTDTATTPTSPTSPANGHDRSSTGKSSRTLLIVIWPIAFVAVAIAAMLIQRPGQALEKISLSPKGVEIFYNLAKAIETSPDNGKTGTAKADLSSIQATAQKASQLSLEGASILWVDGHPEHNEYERKALEALGIRFVIATTTDQALDLMSHQKFSLVITNFKRDDDPQAGYTLLRAIRHQPNPTPTVIYSSSANAGYDEDSKNLGAVGETNNPQTLFDIVIQTIKSS
jgi:CheY-like chemotaxis protein